jgi:hypothetical protein
VDDRRPRLRPADRDRRGPAKRAFPERDGRSPLHRGTEFYLATEHIYAIQQLLDHADVGTTANIYVQGSSADLEDKLKKVWGE